VPGILLHEKGLHDISRKRSDRLLADLGEKRPEIFGVTFAGSSGEGGDLKKVLEGTSQVQWVERDVCFHELLHLMRNLEYTCMQVQSRMFVGKWQDVAPNGLLGAIKKNK
jgi:hypothetical protein